MSIVETLKDLLGDERGWLALVGGVAGTIVCFVAQVPEPPTLAPFASGDIVTWIGIFAALSLLMLILLGRGAQVTLHAREVEDLRKRVEGAEKSEVGADARARAALLAESQLRVIYREEAEHHTKCELVNLRMAKEQFEALTGKKCDFTSGSIITPKTDDAT